MTTAALSLPVFPHHHYSVQVSEIGEDADFVGHGHISPMRFIAACNRVARVNWGSISLVDGTGVIDSSYAELRSSVRHVWAVRRDHGTEPDPEEWEITWEGVGANTPGAFPITLGLWS